MRGNSAILWHMGDTSSMVESHYGTGGLVERLRGSLAALGTDIRTATLEQISSIDQFHACGLDATRRLIGHSGFEQGMHVLDIGSGPGGPARCLAELAGCRVTGIDLTAEYVQAATLITTERGLSEGVTFVHGSALDMPFGDATFDGAWMQHMNMNILDKLALCKEVCRVLKPGARLALHEFFSVGGGEPDFPVPWATSGECSFLADQAEFQTFLNDAGFKIEVWNDESNETIQFFIAIFERAATFVDKPVLGPGVLLGPRFGQMAQNVFAALQQGRISVAMAVVSKK